MKTHLLLAILHCALFLSAQTDRNGREQYSRITIPDPDEATLTKILQAGIDLHCGSHLSMKDGIRTLEVECSQQELHLLEQESINYSILISNVDEFYTHRASLNLGKAKASLAARKQESLLRQSTTGSCVLPQYPVPSHFTLGELGGFLFYQQILEMLDSMAVLYPQLITLREPVSDSIRTHQGRPVFWVKISDNVDVDEAEPEVLYTALTHAREPASAMSLLYYMWFLLENYEGSPEVRRIVDHTELYFVPVLNPDGYVYNETIAPQGGGMWRKNMHDNDANAIIDGKDGVDLNRNFGYLWGYDNIGSSPFPSVSTYRGESPFSEPETRMLMEFVLQREFVTTMNNHSYGNDLYHAWEHGPSPLPDRNIFYRLSDLMTWENRYLFGESYNTYWLGAINGGANDWFYGEQTLKPRIFSWLSEIGNEFWPDPLDIVQICADQLEPHLTVAKIAGQHAEIYDLNQPGITYGQNTLTFRVENLGLQQGNCKVSLLPASNGITDFFVKGGGEVTFREVLESSKIKIDITIDTHTPDGSIIEFDILVEGEEYVVMRKRISKFINPVLILPGNEISDELEMWETNVWGVVGDPNAEGVHWITDSPKGNQLNAYNTIRLRDTIDLSDVTWARATFSARWSIETTHDFVQFQARRDGGEWIALCGRYTKPGALGNPIDIPSPHAGQPVGEPLYDGRQLTRIREQVDLVDFMGEDHVEFRFVAWSGGTVSIIEEDGFYFTDFEVYASRKEHCVDGLMNADEEGIDCGGADCISCPTCEDGILNGDEQATDCGGMLCVPCASCTDGIQNGDEEGIDCGGSTCNPCATCTDKVQNGDEEGIDCGGVCVPCSTCHDGIQNGEEEGIDCGGNCEACAPTCKDGILNGDEEDVDCGGSCPLVCIADYYGRENKIWYNVAGLSITLMPNPVKNQVTIRATWQDVIAQPFALLFWEIIDITGVHIAHGEMRCEDETRIDLSMLSPQLYLIRVSDTQGRTMVQRFFKQD